MDDDANECQGGILVVGLGNELLRDDGVGVHAARLLKKSLAGRALVAEVGTAVLNALHLFEAAEKIVAIDAMQAGGEAGAVYAIAPGDVAVNDQMLSIHELNLIGAMRFLPEDKRKKEIRIIGVEPELIEFGMELTDTVQAALPRVAELAKQYVSAWEAGEGNAAPEN